MADFNLTELFGNRNFQNLLAGIGTNLDPYGAGGAIGRPTQQLIKNLAAQEATAKQQEFATQLAKMLGGITPKEEEGLTSMTMKPGSVALDITPPGVAGGAMGSEEPTGALETGGVRGKGSSLLPFWQALLG